MLFRSAWILIFYNLQKYHFNSHFTVRNFSIDLPLDVMKFFFSNVY